MTLPLMSLLRRRKPSPEQAFGKAVDEVEHLYSVRRLPDSVRLLNPRLNDRYQLAKFSADFFSHLASEDVRRNNRSPGVVLATVSPPSKTTNRLGLGFVNSLVADAGGQVKISFSPEQPCLAIGAEAFQARLSSFAHVVLLSKNGKPVVFVPIFQKVIGIDRKAKSNDHFLGVHGPHRHFLHLAVAGQIVDSMKRQGVEAELHVAHPSSLVFTSSTPEETKKRSRRPLEKLAGHFESDSLQLCGFTINTINLSQPKH